MSISPQNIEVMKNVADGVAVVGTVGTVIELFPAIASLFTIIWFGLRIWKTDIIRRITGSIIKKLKRNNGEGA
jgi:hypothetical protein